jgi:hypothetical protein
VLANDLISRDRKGTTKGDVRKYDPQFAVYYNQWLTYDVDDAACGCVAKLRGGNSSGWRRGRRARLSPPRSLPRHDGRPSR